MQNACTQCSAPFQITDADLARLDGISPVINGKKYSIPAPTLCPNCRVQRRMAWRNDRTFFHRKCDLSGKSFISMYPQDTVFPVYKQDEWHGDKWDGLSFGRTFDFTRPFFEQWAELRDQVPHWGVAISNCENSDYCNYCTDERNCYLDIAAEGNEDCYFDLFVKNSTNCVDCTFAYESTLCYECIQAYNCYSCRNSMYLDNCSDCAFCFDMKGCKNCLLSSNLRNCEYYILNEKHTKEEYEKKLAELRLDSHGALQNVHEIWKNMRIDNGIYRDMYNLNCENVQGNNLKNCKNTFFSFNATNCEDCSYLFDVLDAKDCMDMSYTLYDPEASYEIMSTVGTKYCAFVMSGPYNSNCFYGFMLQSCKNCFGCIGLKQKQYCIFNVQYTKEEYETLVPQIIDHMISTGEWGQFFPAHLSPHGYNETVADEYMPMNKEQVQTRGWKWVDDPEQENYMGAPIEVPDSIDGVDKSICDQILICEASGKPYKVIEQELKFYQQQNIPIPRRSPVQRHKDRNALRNPRALWNRNCIQCNSAIVTSYDETRPEKVHCESCYLTHVK